jgi:cystathionine beta-lyase family protein involved in aluminum resistance
MIAGSLIKNPGGGLAKIGGYIAGRKDLIERCGYRLTAPGMYLGTVFIFIFSRSKLVNNAPFKL